MDNLEKQTYSMPEAAKVLGISVKTAYEGCKKGEIPAFKIMGRWIVPKPALDKMLNGDLSPLKDIKKFK